MTFLSVVIPTFDKAPLLSRTLAALEAIAPEAGPDWEVVVVDDGSRGEATQEVLREFGSRLPLLDASAPTNEGRARARNRGWKAASGEVVLFLDDDILLRPGALAAHSEAQRRETAVWMGAVVTAAEVIDSILFDYLDSRGTAKLRPGERPPARYLLTQNVSVPRRWLEAVGGFDEDFGAWGFEDMELAFRLERDTGCEFGYLPDAVGEHVHHHTLAEYLDKKRSCGASTLPRIAELHPDRIHEMRLDLLPGIGPDTGLGIGLELSWKAGLPAVVGALIQRWPRDRFPGLAFRALDYLVLAAYRDGLRSRLP